MQDVCENVTKLFRKYLQQYLNATFFINNCNILKGDGIGIKKDDARIEITQISSFTDESRSEVKVEVMEEEPIPESCNEDVDKLEENISLDEEWDNDGDRMEI